MNHNTNSNDLIIIASSCEDLAKSLKLCGFNIFSIALHESVKLNKISKKTFYVENFLLSKLKKIIDEIDPKQKKKILLGSGLAEKIFRKNPFLSRENIGNNTKTINKLNNASKFFNLLSCNNIDFPVTRSDIPVNGKNWIKKKISSLGGTQINYLKKKTHINKSKIYFQKFVEGKVISVQFSVMNRSINILSFCSQWNHHTKKSPFLLGGIMNEIIPKSLKQKIYKIVLKVNNIFKLNGINSLDFIVPFDNYNSPKLLEINGRPGLSINLLSKIYKKRLFNETITYKKPKKFYSSAVIYSKEKLILNEDKLKKLNTLSKFYEISELPILNKKILKNQPICLVHSQSKSYLETKKKIKKISDKIMNLVYN